MGDFFIGTNRPKQIFIGTNEVSAVYVGTTKVWEKDSGQIDVFDGTLKIGTATIKYWQWALQGDEPPATPDLVYDNPSTDAMAFINAGQINSVSGFFERFGSEWLEVPVIHISNLPIGEWQLAGKTTLHIKLDYFYNDNYDSSPKTGIRFNDSISNLVENVFDFTATGNDIEIPLYYASQTATVLRLIGDYTISKIWVS